MPVPSTRQFVKACTGRPACKCVLGFVNVLPLAPQFLQAFVLFQPRLDLPKGGWNFLAQCARSLGKLKCVYSVLRPEGFHLFLQCCSFIRNSSSALF